MSEKKPHPLHRAWAAGFFESRNQWPTSGYTLRIETMIEDLINRFYEIVGIGKIDVTYSKVKATYIFRTTNMDDTRELLLLLSPFFTGSRLKMATDMIGRIERNPIWQKQNPEKTEKALLVSQSTSPDS